MRRTREDNISELLARITEFHRRESLSQENQRNVRRLGGHIQLSVDRKLNIIDALDNHEDLLKHGYTYMGVGILADGTVGSFYIRKGVQKLTLRGVSFFRKKPILTDTEILSTIVSGNSIAYETTQGKIVVEIDESMS